MPFHMEMGFVGVIKVFLHVKLTPKLSNSSWSVAFPISVLTTACGFSMGNTDPHRGNSSKDQALLSLIHEPLLPDLKDTCVLAKVVAGSSFSSRPSNH